MSETLSLLERAGFGYTLMAGRRPGQALAVTTFNVLIGNSDAHGKNIGLLHPMVETVELAPLYDTVPTALWPKLRHDGAMTVGGRVRLASVTPKDIVTEARS